MLLNVLINRKNISGFLLCGNARAIIPFFTHFKFKSYIILMFGNFPRVSFIKCNCLREYLPNEFTIVSVVSFLHVSFVHVRSVEITFILGNYFYGTVNAAIVLNRYNI